MSSAPGFSLTRVSRVSSAPGFSLTRVSQMSSAPGFSLTRVSRVSSAPGFPPRLLANVENPLVLLRVVIDAPKFLGRRRDLQRKRQGLHIS